MKRNLFFIFLLLVTLSIATPLRKRAFFACLNIGDLIVTEVFPNPPVPTGAVTFSVAGPISKTILEDSSVFVVFTDLNGVPLSDPNSIIEQKFCPLLLIGANPRCPVAPNSFWKTILNPLTAPSSLPNQYFIFLELVRKQKIIACSVALCDSSNCYTSTSPSATGPSSTPSALLLHNFGGKLFNKNFLYKSFL